MRKVTIKSYDAESDTGGKVYGIKTLRNATGLGLKEAKEMVEDLMEKNPVPIVMTVHSKADLVDLIRGGFDVFDMTSDLFAKIRECAIQAVNENQDYLAIELLEAVRRHDGESE